MAAANKTVWGIHTMDDPLFLNQNLIAIGWEEMGDLSAISTSRDAYKEKYIAAYPDAKKGSIATSAGMLYRFVHEVQEGDYVVFPSKIDRKINIGVVESAYFYEATAALYPNRRKVKWLKHLPRTAFSQEMCIRDSSSHQRGKEGIFNAGTKLYARGGSGPGAGHLQVPRLSLIHI